MKIAAFTASKSYTSARFRVRQFIPLLQEQGVDVHEFIAPIYKHLDPGFYHPLYLRMIRYARPISLLPSVAASHLYAASWIQRWGGGLPQYAPGHLDRIAAARAVLPPGLALAGAAFDGVGIPACVASGERAADDVSKILEGEQI